MGVLTNGLSAQRITRDETLVNRRTLSRRTCECAEVGDELAGPKERHRISHSLKPPLRVTKPQRRLRHAQIGQRPKPKTTELAAALAAQQRFVSRPPSATDSILRALSLDLHCDCAVQPIRSFVHSVSVSEGIVNWPGRVSDGLVVHKIKYIFPLQRDKPTRERKQKM